MFGWSISAERLPLGLEAGHHLAGVHARLDDLQRDFALHRLGLLGDKHPPEAALADLLPQQIPADTGADAFEKRIVVHRLIGRRWECVRFLFVHFQECPHPAGQSVVVAARLAKKQCPSVGVGDPAGGVKKPLLILQFG